MKFISRSFRPALMGSLVLVAGASQAAAVDVTAVVTDIGAQVASIIAIGGAVLLVMVAVKAFRWVRAALS